MSRNQIRTRAKGVTFDCPLTGLPRQKIIADVLENKDSLLLIADNHNPYSKTGATIALLLEKNGRTYHLGFLEEDVALRVRGFWSLGRQVTASADYIRGGKGGKSYGVEVELYASMRTGDPITPPTSTAVDNAHKNPAPKSSTKKIPATQKKSRFSCLKLVLLVIAISIGLFICLVIAGAIIQAAQ